MKNSKPTPQQIKDIIKNKKNKNNGQKQVEKVSDSESEEERKSDSYESLSGAEDLEDYKVEGYHPTLLGESFSNGRYIITQKLGWGHFSTVWLVLDKKKEEYFALKIQKSKKSYSEAAQDELDLLRDLRKHETDEDWKKFVDELNQQLNESKWIKNWGLKKQIQVEELMQKEQEKEQLKELKKEKTQFDNDDELFEDVSDNDEDEGEDPSILIPSYDDEALKFRITQDDTYSIRLIDNFVHYGIHGKHFCSVFEILGPTLLDLIQHFDNYDKKIGVWLVKIIARQLLVGLVYMHDVCQMIHTDLKPENIMIDLEPDQKKEFIEDLKNLKKKPLSMKFLHLLQQRSSAKNKKKYLKKKNKKKQQQEEETKTNDPNESTKPTDQPSENQTKIDQSTSISNDNQPAEEKDEKKSSEKNDMPKKQEKREKQQKKTKEKNEAKDMELEKAGQDIKTEENDGIQEEKKEANKNEENGKKKKTRGEQKDESQDGSDSGYETDHTPSVDEETLYTLKWKEHIKIKLTKSLRVKIVDFGNACWTHKHFTDNIQTREYRSPEVILGIDYQANTDIWSFACIIFELLTDNYLFKPKKGDGFGKSDVNLKDHLALMIETLGKMNKGFALNGSRSRKYFNKSGHLINIKQLNSMPICDILINDYDFEMNEAYQIQDFLMPMLEYDPKKRINARDALKHPWLWSY